jgi:hypothetical protein
MPRNPYSAAFGRYFEMALCSTGAVLFFYLAISCVLSGRASSLGRYSTVSGKLYTAANNPSQFWLIVLVYIVACTLFALFALRAYRK